MVKKDKTGEKEKKRTVEEEKKNEKPKAILKEKEISEKNPKKYEKQTKIAVIIMLALIGIVLFSYWVMQSMNKFDYKGMEFFKEKEGSIQYYKSIIGFATASGENIPFILKLRNDPRDLEKIPIDGNIKIANKEVVLSLSPEITNCSDTFKTMLDFSRTLSSFGYDVTAGTTSREYSKENEVKQATCKQAKDKTVIIMKEGEENKITVNKEAYPVILIRGEKETRTTKYYDCYTIELSGCETQEGFERFILESISNSRVS